MSGRARLTLSLVEAAHLADLIEQFTELLGDAVGSERVDDPAIARLVPDAYRGDPEAAAEFRRLTQGDLLARRRDEATVMLASLRAQEWSLRLEDLAAGDATADVEVALDEQAITAWLRTLTAVRLVMAVRLGIDADDSDDLDDPRFGVYHWLGYRLDGLLQAIDE